MPVMPCKGGTVREQGIDDANPQHGCCLPNTRDLHGKYAVVLVYEGCSPDCGVGVVLQLYCRSAA